MTEQLTFNVTLKPEATFATFYPGKNQQLVETLQTIAQNPGNNFIYMWGHQGVGKTHLLQACCELAQRSHMHAMYFPFEYLNQYHPSLFDNVEQSQLVCIDDLYKISGLPQWEEAFFDCYNRLFDHQKTLIITNNTAPKASQLQLADLISRLSATTVFHLLELTDKEKLIALQLHATSRGLTLSPEAGHYLLNHYPRDLPQLYALLNQLDQAALVHQRKLTVPFIKAVLH